MLDPDLAAALDDRGVILFDASTWHGHTANTSASPRRSLQATFIPRRGRPATDFMARMRPETLARLDAVARYLIRLESDGSPSDASSPG